ncbi:MAG TPA: hypothetical protein VN739_01605 [Nitrososphaerales archaeon]|nr:hypothetical protein [Nitrososphaerales archaeon]
MVNVPLIVGLTVLVIAVVAVINLVAMRTRHHYTSTLTCPNCQRTFEYKWVPGVSFTTVRLGKSRYLECQLCHKWATFNVWNTRKEAPKG